MSVQLFQLLFHSKQAVQIEQLDGGPTWSNVIKLVAKEETAGLAEETAAGADPAVNVETQEAVMEHIFAEETEEGGEVPLTFEIEDEPFEEDEPSVEEIPFEAIPEEEIPEEKMTEKILTKPEPERENVPEPVPEPEPEPEKPYIFPPIQLLGEDPQNGGGDSKAELLANARKLETTLKSFGVEAKVIQINKGPTVTRYELSPSQGVKVSKIVNLADDIALNLAASGIRIEAPIPGKAAVGIEVPNKETQSVYLRTVLESEAFKEHSSRLAFALGEDIAGNPVVTDIAKMPHLLIAGATGSGKSVCINTLIMSVLYKAKPEEVRLIMVDPKVVELSIYNGIPHLMIPVVTDCPYPSAFPMATTCSPTFNWEESPMTATLISLKVSAGISFKDTAITPTSLLASVPLICASTASAPSFPSSTLNSTVRFVEPAIT